MQKRPVPLSQQAMQLSIAFSTVISGLKTTAYCTLLISSLPYYIRHSAFLESFSLSLLYLTVLSFSGQMITYLISVVWAERGEDWCTASRCRECCLRGVPSLREISAFEWPCSYIIQILVLL